MARHRHANVAWNIRDLLGKPNVVSGSDAQLAVLMDIRDELQAINAKLGCYRIPRALDACIELGAEARRRKRNAAKRRKAANK